MFQVFGFLFLCVSSTSLWASEMPSEFVVRKTSVVQMKNGVDGTLELLEDARLTEDDRKILNEHDPDVDLNRSPRFREKPVYSAIIRLRTKDSRVFHDLKLEKPTAELQSVKLGSDGDTAFFITQDFGIGMGSYNGPVTKILNLGSHPLVWASALDQRTNKRIEISLMRSLKTAWNFAPSKNNVGKDILKVSCRPNLEQKGFSITYLRYHFEKGDWVVSQRAEPGFWEAEDSDIKLGYLLPDLRKFP